MIDENLNPKLRIHGTKKGGWPANCLDRSEGLRRETGSPVFSSEARGGEQKTGQPIASSEAKGKERFWWTGLFFLVLVNWSTPVTCKVFCKFRTQKSWKIRGTLICLKRTQNKGYTTVMGKIKSRFTVEVTLQFYLIHHTIVTAKLRPVKLR